MKVRIRFTKTESMRFFGHLDLLRYFQKSIKRAGFDIAYSEGFSPHQIMSFACPLGVGLSSEGEYCDIVLNSHFGSAKMVEKLNEVMVEGIEIKSMKELDAKEKNAMASVFNAEYYVNLKESFGQADWINKFDAFVNQNQINILKKTKKSEKIVDIKPFINKAYVDEKGIFLSLKTGSSKNLKPELVMQAFYNYCNDVFYDESAEIEKIKELPTFEPFSFDIIRLDLFDENMKSLGDFGKEF